MQDVCLFDCFTLNVNDCECLLTEIRWNHHCHSSELLLLSGVLIYVGLGIWADHLICFSFARWLAGCLKFIIGWRSCHTKCLRSWKTPSRNWQLGVMDECPRCVLLSLTFIQTFHMSVTVQYVWSEEGQTWGWKWVKGNIIVVKVGNVKCSWCS